MYWSVVITLAAPYPSERKSSFTAPFSALAEVLLFNRSL